MMSYLSSGELPAQRPDREQLHAVKRHPVEPHEEVWLQEVLRYEQAPGKNPPYLEQGRYGQVIRGDRLFLGSREEDAVEVRLEQDTVWLSLTQMALLFERDSPSFRCI